MGFSEERRVKREVGKNGEEMDEEKRSEYV